MPGLNDLLVRISTDAATARKFKASPTAVMNDARLTDIEQSVMLSRDPQMIQSSLHSAALKGSLAAAGDTVWTVIVVI